MAFSKFCPQSVLLVPSFPRVKSGDMRGWVVLYGIEKILLQLEHLEFEANVITFALLGMI